jgi:hypothetical protein
VRVLWVVTHSVQTLSRSLNPRMPAAGSLSLIVGGYAPSPHPTRLFTTYTCSAAACTLSLGQAWQSSTKAMLLVSSNASAKSHRHVTGAGEGEARLPTTGPWIEKVPQVRASASISRPRFHSPGHLFHPLTPRRSMNYMISYQRVKPCWENRPTLKLWRESPDSERKSLPIPSPHHQGFWRKARKYSGISKPTQG